MQDLPAITHVALRWHLLATAALCAAAAAMSRGDWIKGLVCGGAIGAANLLALGWIGKRLLEGDPSAKMRAALLLAFKLAVVGGVVLGALIVVRPDPMALLAAFTLAPAALMVAARSAMNALPVNHALPVRSGIAGTAPEVAATAPAHGPASSTPAS